MFAFLEGPEAIVVAVVLLLIFGANRVPKLARQLGQAQRELKKGIEEGFSGEKEADEDATPAAGAADTSAPTTDAVAADGPGPTVTAAAEQPPVVPVTGAAPAGEPAVVAPPSSFAPPLPPPKG